MWVAADSTELVVWAADEPVGGVAGSGGLIARLERPRYRLEDGCRLRVDGHLATVARFRHVDARGTDTVFGAVANVLVRRGLAVAAMALSPSCAMRDSLVGAISDLRVETPGR